MKNVLGSTVENVNGRWILKNKKNVSQTFLQKMVDSVNTQYQSEVAKINEDGDVELTDGGYRTNISFFEKQYFQHNTKDAQRISSKDIMEMIKYDPTTSKALSMGKNISV
ncbi:MAG: hypothetical protein LBG80_08865 [Bacteroidales bacterium]|jgi:hypothetical protein|nr:hypothetical protein [Bacteroidales bacterium]